MTRTLTREGEVAHAYYERSLRVSLDFYYSNRPLCQKSDVIIVLER